MHSNFYEVRISKIDPVATRAPPSMQNMSKNMAKMSTSTVVAKKIFSELQVLKTESNSVWSCWLPRHFN
jgi:hypothetical protein